MCVRERREGGRERSDYDLVVVHKNLNENHEMKWDNTHQQ